MSKHWSPDGKIVRIRWAGRRRWTRSGDYWAEHKRRMPRLPAPALIAGVLALACIAVWGAFQLLGQNAPANSGGWSDAPIEWNAVQAPPGAELSAEDLEWQQRAAASEETPDGAGEIVRRISFGFCHSGGGTNCVVDGDTFYMGGEKVRIAGIDAPETHDYGCPSELALGEQATERLQALLNSGAVTMTAIDRDRDVYGRLLRNVQAGGQDVGEALIGAGLAREYGRGRRSWCG